MDKRFWGDTSKECAGWLWHVWGWGVLIIKQGVTGIMKKLTFKQFFAEEEKLKKRARKINKMSGNLMLVVTSRIKRNKYAIKR